MRRARWLEWGALGWLICTSVAWAQTYPTRPVRILVPFGPESGSDIVARRLGAYLQERWKQAVTIDNWPGAQGIIGAEALR